MHGRLQRESTSAGLLSVWRERYLLLTDSSALACFASLAAYQQRQPPIETALLQGALLSNPKSARRGRYAFRLDTFDENGAHKWMLSSSNANDALSWVHALEAAGIASSFSTELMYAQFESSSAPNSPAPIAAPDSLGKTDETPAEGMAEQNSSAAADDTPTDGISELEGKSAAHATPARGSSELEGKATANSIPADGSSELGGTTPAEEPSELEGKATVNTTPAEGSSELEGKATVNTTPAEGSSELEGKATVNTTPAEGSSELEGKATVDTTPAEGSSELEGKATVNTTPAEGSSELEGKATVDTTPAEVSSEPALVFKEALCSYDWPLARRLAVKASRLLRLWGIGRALCSPRQATKSQRLDVDESQQRAEWLRSLVQNGRFEEAKALAIYVHEVETIEAARSAARAKRGDPAGWRVFLVLSCVITTIALGLLFLYLGQTPVPSSEGTAVPSAPLLSPSPPQPPLAKAIFTATPPSPSSARLETTGTALGQQATISYATADLAPRQLSLGVLYGAPVVVSLMYGYFSLRRRASARSSSLL